MNNDDTESLKQTIIKKLGPVGRVGFWFVVGKVVQFGWLVSLIKKKRVFAVDVRNLAS